MSGKKLKLEKLKLETREEVLVLEVTMTPRAQSIIQHRFNLKKVTELMVSQHMEQIQELLEANRPRIRQQMIYLYQIQPHTYLFQRSDRPFEVHMLSRIAGVEKKWWRKKRLYWRGIICAPEEANSIEAKLKNLENIPSTSNRDKPMTSPSGRRKESPYAGKSSPSVAPPNGRRMRPQSLPFSNTSFMYKAPAEFEKFDALAESVPDIERQMMRMRDGVAANLLMWQQFATAEPTATIGGVDPRVEANKTLIEWVAYAEYVGITDENLRRAREAFDKGKAVHSLMDGALIIID